MKVTLALLVTALLAAGCGSGGGSTGSTAPAAPGSGSILGQQGGTAVVVVSTRAATPQTVVYAVEFKLVLPPGVTLPADPASGEVPAGALQVSDSAALAKARFLPAAAGANGYVLVNILDTGGFTVGGLVTLSCSAAPGRTVDASDFSLDGFSARDANGAPLQGVTPLLAVRTQ